MKRQTIVIIICVLIVTIIIVFMTLSKFENLYNDQLDSERCVKNLTTYYKGSEFNNKSFVIGYNEGLKNEITSLINEYNMYYEEPRSNSTQYIIIKTQEGEVLRQICIISKDIRIKERVRYIEPSIINSVNV